MKRRAPITHARPRSDRANAAAHELLEFFDDPALPAGELHLRVWRLLMDEFDSIEEEIRDET